MKYPSKEQGAVVVRFEDRNAPPSGNTLALVKARDGMIWAEGHAQHGPAETITVVQLGRFSDLLPRVCTLVGPGALVLRDRRYGREQLKLSRTLDGSIWAELAYRSGRVAVYTGLLVGSVYTLIPRLAELA